MKCRYPSARRTVTSEPTEPFLNCAIPVSVSIASNRSTSEAGFTVASADPSFFHVPVETRGNVQRMLLTLAIRACAAASLQIISTALATLRATQKGLVILLIHRHCLSLNDERSCTRRSGV